MHAQGLVIRDLPLIASNYRSTEDLSSYLKRHNIVAIADIDTRKLTRLLREKGAQNGCIIAGENLDETVALEKAKAFPGLNGMDLAKEVTTQESYSWTQGSWTLADELPEAKQESELPYHVVAYDYGAKRNILRMLVDRGCRLTVVPAQTPAAEVLKMNPDGIFLSNGPGDPAPCDYAIDAIKAFLETDIPVFGICLGHQLLALPPVRRQVEQRLYPRKYNDLVEQYAAEYDLDPLLVYSFIRTESGFDPGATSSVDARGLMQMTEETFLWLRSKLGLGEEVSFGDLYDPDVSIRFGCYYLHLCLVRYNGDISTAAAAYHSGWGTVDALLQKEEHSEDGLTLSGFPYNQMHHYVEKITACYAKYTELYGA